MQSEKETQMVEQLAESREEIRRLRGQLEVRLATEETRHRQPRQRAGDDVEPERRLPGTSDLRGKTTSTR